jgi:hypothetical protein
MVLPPDKTRDRAQMAARAADKIAFLLFDFKTCVSFLNAHRTALYYGRQKMGRKTRKASGKTSARQAHWPVTCSAADLSAFFRLPVIENSTLCSH